MIANNSLQLTYSRYGIGLQISAFSFAVGAKLNLLAPSGLGKTALLNLIAGIFPSGG